MNKLENWNPDKNIYGEFELKRHFTQDTINLGEIFSFEKGEFIYQTGDQIEHFYIFLKGSGKVYMIKENGKVLLLEFYRPYQAIGDLEFINDAIGSTEVECTSPSILLRFPMRRLKQIAWNHPPLLRFIIKELGRKLFNASVNRSNNQLYPLNERLLDYFSKNAKDEIFTLSVKQSDIAEYFGVSERHFRRVLKDLEEKNLIKREGKRIEILN